MTEYLRAYIPACEGYGWEGGPEFSTTIVQLRSGREQRNAAWAQPRHFYSLPFVNITQQQYAPIKQMHMNRRGRWGVFLYRDRLDDQAEDEIFAVAEPGQDTFQLGKWSIIDGVSYYRHVTALYAPDGGGAAVEADPTITVDGTQTSTFTVDHDRGLIVFNTPMSGGEILRWTGEFSVWVRFDNDRLPFSIDNRSGGDYVVNGQVDLLEMPPPPEVPSSS